MEYNILNKINLINGSIVFTPLGYLVNSNDCDTINANYNATYLNWVNNNKSDLENGNINISIFFDTTPEIYEAHQVTTSVDGMGLNEITDITPYI